MWKKQRLLHHPSCYLPCSPLSGVAQSTILLTWLSFSYLFIWTLLMLQVLLSVSLLPTSVLRYFQCEFTPYSLFLESFVILFSSRHHSHLCKSCGCVSLICTFEVLRGGFMSSSSWYDGMPITACNIPKIANVQPTKVYSPPPWCCLNTGQLIE